MTVDTTKLATYLATDIDEDRAELLISLAEAQVEPITGSPIPDAADAVILSSVTRAYLNPTNAATQSAGPFTAAFPSGGVYLTRAERAALMRTVGGGQHFVVETLPKLWQESGTDS